MVFKQHKYPFGSGKQEEKVNILECLIIFICKSIVLYALNWKGIVCIAADSESRIEFCAIS